MSDEVVDLLFQMCMTVKSLEEKGFWIKRQYADQILDILGVDSDGKTKVCDVLALTDDPAKGIASRQEFVKALLACFGEQQSVDVNELLDKLSGTFL